MIVVIMSGGAGSRLWPVSRELHPKPFIRLPDGQSLLQKAFLRAAALTDVQQIMTVTNREHFFKTEDEYAEVDRSGRSLAFLLEPFGRNTAAAIAAATLEVERTHGANEKILVLAADHLISNQAAFAAAVVSAGRLSEVGKLVTFGIQPKSPETGYGYIEAEGQEVKRFVEKPSYEVATQYLKSGKHYWNSGMFCFSAGVMRQEMEKHCPAILDAVKQSLQSSRRATGENFSQVELDAETFAKVPEDSIDFAVMEKSQNVAVVPCDIGWSDIGSWTAFGELQQADKDGNRISGEVILLETQDCIIQSENRLVGALGLSNLVIVDTSDALLVSTKDKVQDVKKIVAQLKSVDHQLHKFHKTVHRPWGIYTVLEEAADFKIKRIEVKPGASLSLQLHHHRSEHWIVVQGLAKVVNGDETFLLHMNESTFIPAMHKHRLENPSDEPLVMIEVQTGSYLGEDDIVRFSDVYGRVG